MGDDIHSCGLYGWMALCGVWLEEKPLCELELKDTADSGVLACCGYALSDDVMRGLRR